MVAMRPKAQEKDYCYIEELMLLLRFVGFCYMKSNKRRKNQFENPAACNMDLPLNTLSYISVAIEHVPLNHTKSEPKKQPHTHRKPGCQS